LAFSVKPLAIGARHHAVHDAEGFEAGKVSLQPRDSGFDPLSRRLDVCETLLRDLAPSDALQSGRQSGLRLRPFVISGGKTVQSGTEGRVVLRGLRQRLHAALDAGKRDVRSELIDLLSGQRIGENARHAVLGVERGPVARGVVADGEGADITIVQVAKPFVEALGVIGRAVVAVLEALREVELQPRLETEDDVAEAAQRLGASVDQKDRHREQFAFDPVDVGRLRLARRHDEFKPAARRHRRGAVRDHDALRRVAGIQRYRQPRLAWDAAPVDGASQRRLRLLTARLGRFARLGKKDGVIEARLGHVVAPGDTRLQCVRIARQQNSQAERGRFERADGRALPTGRCYARGPISGNGARSRPLSLSGSSLYTSARPLDPAP
jgi:hypothetical protein